MSDTKEKKAIDSRFAGFYVFVFLLGTAILLLVGLGYFCNYAADNFGVWFLGKAKESATEDPSEDKESNEGTFLFIVLVVAVGAIVILYIVILLKSDGLAKVGMP